MSFSHPGLVVMIGQIGLVDKSVLGVDVETNRAFFRSTRAHWGIGTRFVRRGVLPGHRL